MLCEFAVGARGTFEASRSIVGPESQMAFEVYGTKGALRLEPREAQRAAGLPRRGRAAHRLPDGVRRRPLPVPRALRPGQRQRHRLRGPRRDRGLRVLPLGRRAAASTGRASATRVAWVSVQAALLRSAGVRPLGGRRIAAGGLMEATTTATLRIGVLGVGRIGRMHADLLARQVPGATVAARLTTPTRSAARAASRRVGAPDGVEELLATDDVDAVAICTTHRHPRRPDRRGRARRQGDLLREADLARPRPRSTARWPRSTRPASRSRSASTGASTPRHAAVRDAVARGDVGDPQLVRITSRDPAPPPMEYVRGSGGIFLDMTIHDFDMARFVTGSEVVEVFARGGGARRPGDRRRRRRRHRGRRARCTRTAA